MVHKDEYEREKGLVSDLPHWAAFARKWFPTETWPRKGTRDATAVAPHPWEPLFLGGRKWRRVSYAYDISPEARYEYVYTKSTLGDPIKFPYEQNSPRTPAEGWRQECPYDEIVTQEIGDDICPKCGRKLVFSRVSE
jgi:hypothetical protein